MTLFDVAVVLAAWAFLLSSTLLRTTRIAIVLGALTAVFVAAGLVGAPGASIIRIVVTWIYLFLFWRFQFWLAGLSRIDEHIDSQLRQAMREVTVAHRRWTSSFARGDIRPRGQRGRRRHERARPRSREWTDWRHRATRGGRRSVWSVTTSSRSATPRQPPVGRLRHPARSGVTMLSSPSTSRPTERGRGRSAGQLPRRPE